jgi:hypothetical protein
MAGKAIGTTRPRSTPASPGSAWTSPAGSPNRKAGVTGGDTWAATDPVPYPDEPACAFCVHQYLQTRHGIVNQENMTLKQLADDGVYVFTYLYSPVPITSATGSTGAPVAID